MMTTQPAEQFPSAETILVTGGTGFVGANVVRHMALSAHRVIAYDLSPPPSLVERYWGEARERITFEAGDVTDESRLADVAARHSPTAIIHAAAVTTVDKEAEARMATRVVDVNLTGTLRVLDLARKIGVRRMLYVSSGGVYGSTDPDNPVTEDAPHQARTLYAIAKKTSELLCLRYRDLFGLDVVVGRLGQPFGPAERDTGVRSVFSPVFQMARAALVRRHVRLPQPNYRCDWTYALDLAEAMRLLLEAPTLKHRIYNLSNGQQRKLSDVAAHLEKLINGAKFVWVDGPGEIDTRADPRRGPLDITRLREDVGFRAKYSLEEGLEVALPWWRLAAASG